jgi:hypothetical protein
MYCTHCGNQLDDNAKFCSSCGTSFSNTSTGSAKARDWDLHVRVLGWLVIVHAATTALLGLIIMFAGQFVQRFLLNNPDILLDGGPGPPPPPEVLAMIAPAAFLIGLIVLLFSVPSLAAGVGLLRYRSWGRILTIVLSVLRLLEFPFGTATAIYSFWILLSDSGKNFYKERAARAEVN